MSMNFNAFYGISFQEAFGDAFTEQFRNADCEDAMEYLHSTDESSNIKDLWEHFYLTDEFDDNSDIAFGVFVDGMDIDEIQKKYEEYTNTHNLKDIFENLKSEYPFLEEAIKVLESKSPKPIMMQVYI